MELKKAYMTNNPCYRAGTTIQPKGLMLHSVGCSQPSANVFYNSWNQKTFSTACVHAFIDANTGIVWQTLPWDRRGWHCGGAGNNTHIGVEMCEPESITYTAGSNFTCSNPSKARMQVKIAYESAVELFAELCTMYGLDPMRDGVIVSHSEGYRRGIATNHGDPEHLWNGLNTGYTMDGFRRDVQAAMMPSAIVYDRPSTMTGASLAGKSNAEVVKQLGELAKKNAKSSGILASISCAQAILESGYSRSELAVNANNLFGMKCKLSGNTWEGSAWDGTSVYSKVTAEVDDYGIVSEETADFRRYPSLAESFADHSAYLIGARNGNKARYAGIKGMNDFDAVAKLLKSGGYATDPAYPDKLKAVRDAWNLSDLDGEQAVPAEEERVEQKPFLVRVSITDLRIRSGPGTQYDFRSYIPVGVYTIVETVGRWGRLKSGAGWIYLDYTSRVV